MFTGGMENRFARKMNRDPYPTKRSIDKYISSTDRGSLRKKNIIRRSLVGAGVGSAIGFLGSAPESLKGKNPNILLRSTVGGLAGAAAGAISGHFNNAKKERLTNDRELYKKVYDPYNSGLVGKYKRYRFIDL